MIQTSLPQSNSPIKKALTKALPAMIGLFFLHIAYGLTLANAGFGILYALTIPTFIFSGSISFILIDFLTDADQLLSLGLLTLFINSRHIFYGLSLYDHIKDYKQFKPYMIFALCDETFTLITSSSSKEETLQFETQKTFFYLAFLNQLSCVAGSVIGNLLGTQSTFSLRGIEFSLTAIFIVALLNNYRQSQNKRPTIIGGLIGIISLLLFGGTHMVLPAITGVMIVQVFQRTIQIRRHRKLSFT